MVDTTLPQPSRSTNMHHALQLTGGSFVFGLNGEQLVHRARALAAEHAAQRELPTDASDAQLESAITAVGGEVARDRKLRRELRNSGVKTEADARLWEVETRAAIAVHRRASSVTFADYATGWLAEFIDDAPDRARFEAALTHRLCPVLGDQLLLEVLHADPDEPARGLVDAGVEEDAAARECLHLILADAADDLRAGALGGRAPFGESRARR